MATGTTLASLPMPPRSLSVSMTWPPAPARAEDDKQTARREIAAHFQASVDAGFAYWRIDDHGHTELHFHSGEVFLLNETGVARLR